MSQSTKLYCKCVYCGFEWTFGAKSKADAARMTGPAICEKPECKEKATQAIYALLREEGLPV